MRDEEEFASLCVMGGKGGGVQGKTLGHWFHFKHSEKEGDFFVCT